MATALRLFHTVRHLRAEQVVFRAYYRLTRPHAHRQPAPPLREQVGEWQSPIDYRQCFDGIDRFTFLNEERSLAQTGWNDPAAPLLWRYNLHYFDDLVASGWSNRRSAHINLIDRWIAENPPGTPTAWDPYTVSRRLVNWIKWILAGNAPSSAVSYSIALQTRWLRSRLEYHLLGNHLFANAKALWFAGLFFGGEEGNAWLAHADHILRREVPEQILADGGQFERSPMYHALALEDMLDMINVAEAYGLAGSIGAIADRWRPIVDRMRHWLAAMAHPDGEISFFNDAAIGIAPPPAALEDYARRLGFGPTAALARVEDMATSGYIRVVEGQATMLMDLAAVGPDYLPGHAHADTLSFELSLGDQRFLVNGGTSIYGDGNERKRQRGTKAHNSVSVDGRNSSDVWSGFRVGQRAKVRERRLQINPEVVVAEGSHDGFLRQGIAGLHRRRWRIDAQGMTITDWVEGPARPAVAWFHFHPDVEIETAADGQAGAARCEEGRVMTWQVQRGTAAMAPSSYHPAFGLSLASNALTLTLHENQSEISFSWFAPSR